MNGCQPFIDDALPRKFKIYGRKSYLNLNKIHIAMKMKINNNNALLGWCCLSVLYNIIISISNVNLLVGLPGYG